MKDIKSMISGFIFSSLFPEKQGLRRLAPKALLILILEHFFTKFIDLFTYAIINAGEGAKSQTLG